jgi:hypothetical protein
LRPLRRRRLVIQPQQRTALVKREAKSQHRLMADSWSYRSRPVPVFQLSGSVYQAQLRISELWIRKRNRRALQDENPAGFGSIGEEAIDVEFSQHG